MRHALAAVALALASPAHSLEPSAAYIQQIDPLTTQVQAPTLKLNPAGPETDSARPGLMGNVGGSATALQYGNANVAVVTQSGFGHNANVLQHGHGNVAIIRQR